jgi:hypothetical protein
VLRGVPESDAVGLIDDQLSNMTLGCFWVLVTAKLSIERRQETPTNF